MKIVENIVLCTDVPRIHEAIERMFMDVPNINRASMADLQDFQIEGMAVNLWNWAVTNKVQLYMNDEQTAKLCHIACKLICMCDTSLASETTVQRQILMNIKAGKGWMDAGNALIADGFFYSAMSRLEQFYAILVDQCCTETHLLIQKVVVEKEVFKVLTYQAESAVIQGNFQKASGCIMRCKDMLMRLPKMIGYLHVLCYKFGVQTHKQNKYNESTFWLSQSYDIGKMDKSSIGPDMLAKVLRSLATVYFDCHTGECYTKGIIAINLANKEFLHPDGLFLKMKILLKAEAANVDILEAVREVLRCEMSIDFCLSIAKLLMDCGRESVGFVFLKKICDHFKSSEHVGKAKLFHIDMLLQRKEDLLAREKIEEIIQGYQMGRPLKTELLGWLHNILWRKAARSFEVKVFADALNWYCYSLKFYGFQKTDLDVAKLQRNVASCYLNLRDFHKAKLAVLEAERLDPTNIFTQFYVFKIAILENNSDKALQAIAALASVLKQEELRNNDLILSGISPTSLINLAAQFALANGQRVVAGKALEYLAQHSEDPKQALSSLKCLFRLVLPKFSQMPESENKKNEMNRLITYFNTALLKLTQLCDEQQNNRINEDNRINEAHWFRKIAWNLAAQSQKEPMIMREFLMASYNLSLLCPSDKVILIAKSTCLLLATSIDLAQGRKAVTTIEENVLLNRVLDQIQKCKVIWNHLKQTGTNFSHHSFEALLLLYEFEAKIKMNDPSLDSFLETMWELPHLDSTILEAIATLAMESPVHYPSIALKALKKALQIHKTKESLNVLKYSKCMHSLIFILLPTRPLTAEFCPLKEIWSHFQDALSFISHNDGYPETEIVWLMTKSWNIGIFMYTKNKLISVEKWCGLALCFLNQLRLLKTRYEIRYYNSALRNVDFIKLKYLVICPYAQFHGHVACLLSPSPAILTKPLWLSLSDTGRVIYGTLSPSSESKPDEITPQY
ncbi:PREDICTED: testis-expressed sequence 11 protein [Dipodomys ordii]|uniref:Protein ZIP4 homolog n=1 Tax=Dipodomys ordii TaxID=10020 RepID=A0A1S3GDZ4_DIPOR|nr:PREDICTED: testis-expressed sequence 11 protein [Dipodomys ordii]